MYFKVIACEIALREICHLAAKSPSVLDLEFLPQGLHDTPTTGKDEIQRRIDAVPAGKYDAVLIGYGLCSSILKDLRAGPTRLVIPRAHDCITFFLGSKERYQECFNARPGTYYFTAGWLEVRARRGPAAASGHGLFMPAHTPGAREEEYARWVEKYGEEQAQYLRETMAEWTAHYTHGTLISFDFTKHLGCGEEVRNICADKRWQYEELPGDTGLLQRWLDGVWSDAEFLLVPPGARVMPSHDAGVVTCAPA